MLIGQICTQQELTLEVKRWKARWELYPTDHVKPSYLCETLEQKKTKKKTIKKNKNISASHPLQQQPKDLSAF